MNKHANVAIFVPHLGCRHRCSFCNQVAISGQQKEPGPEDVVSAAEIALKSGVDSENSEIAFFGGSFTAIDRDYMLSLLKAAFPYVQNGYFKGIRCSTRPDAIDCDTLEILKEYGVSAVELGAQSMDDEVLKLNERGHTCADTVKASNLIKSFGIELGLQMMTGLYGDTDEKCLETAEKIIGLSPKTVRIYPTVVLENTKLCELYRQGKYIPPTLDETVDLCSKLLPMFEKAGIKVIRLGLHSGGGVEEGYVAGCYHPAFREKVESKIFFDKIMNEIREKRLENNILIKCAGKDISKVVGQKKENINKLKSIGYDASVIADENIKAGEVSAENYISKKPET